MTAKEHFNRAVIFGTVAGWLKDSSPDASKELRNRAIFETAKGIEVLAENMKSKAA